MRPRRAKIPLAGLIGEVWESCAMALASIAAHKLRSTLTLLGVVVGVFSIIVVMTAMRALQSRIEGELGGLGANTFTVQKWPGMHFSGPEGWEKYRRRKPLLMELAENLRDRATLAAGVGAENYFFNGPVFSRHAETDPDVALRGVTPEVFAALNLVVAGGRAIQAADLDGARPVCVLGSVVASRLFPQGSAVGDRVKVDGVNYEVLGVLEGKGGMGGTAQDNFILIPSSTAFNRYGGRSLLNVKIYVQARERGSYADAIEEVRGILRTLRKVPPGGEDSFEIYSNESLIHEFREVTFAVRVGMALVSSVALLAAGVGIMNIMLVSVTERTREIGVRRAIGAKKRNILAQFILEAVVLCELGGILGVLLGIAGGNAGAFYLQTPMVVPYDWAVIGLVICSGVGIAFGTYPAIKAANLDPVEALRYE